MDCRLGITSARDGGGPLGEAVPFDEFREEDLFHGDFHLLLKAAPHGVNRTARAPGAGTRIDHAPAHHWSVDCAHYLEQGYGLGRMRKRETAVRTAATVKESGGDQFPADFAEELVRYIFAPGNLSCAQASLTRVADLDHES